MLIKWMDITRSADNQMRRTNMMRHNEREGENDHNINMEMWSFSLGFYYKDNQCAPTH